MLMGGAENVHLEIEMKQRKKTYSTWVFSSPSSSHWYVFRNCGMEEPPRIHGQQRRWTRIFDRAWIFQGDYINHYQIFPGKRDATHCQQFSRINWGTLVGWTELAKYALVVALLCHRLSCWIYNDYSSNSLIEINSINIFCVNIDRPREYHA